MRLIDSDALNKDLKSVTLSNGTLVNTNTILRLLEVYPTAYDPDKVVKQIKELSIRERGEIKTEDVIAIVKGGGVNDRE